VIAGGGVRAVLEAAGVKDVLTKAIGSNNKVNVVKATFEALQLLRSVEQEARRRDMTPEELRRRMSRRRASAAPAETSAPAATVANAEGGSNVTA
jgi:small subunit ribosomal protein S5